MTEEQVRKQIFLGGSKCYDALYQTYSPYIFGQFSSFCSDSEHAVVLTKKVFEIAVLEVKENNEVKGNIMVWLMNISRKISRNDSANHPKKLSNTQLCIKRLILSNGFSVNQAADMLGIDKFEAIKMLRKALKE